MALAWRSRAAMLKGATMLVFALWVLGNTLWHAWSGTLPHAETMGLIGGLALLANGGVALMLYRFRSGDSTAMTSMVSAISARGTVTTIS